MYQVKEPRELLLKERHLVDIHPLDTSKDVVKNHTFLRIGITGHMKLEHIQLLRKSVQRVISLIDKMQKASLKDMPYTYSIISPLAKGADRLVVKEVLEWKVLDNTDKPSLNVVLPLPKEDYIKDFETAASKGEFETVLGRAMSICTLEKATSREAAYENVGHYVVDKCDFLIAIWNGKPSSGQGGTGDIVEYARKAGRHMFWINSEDGSIKEENSGRIN